ncbi:hypothetical protein H5200_07710 [Pseudoalteromonas sp. SG43-7]|uniref:hypothetical protein n=1 Tax=Pseudoalteromonas TaxID=53246 RepID=UPI001230465A|nr:MULTISPECIES: hypothetical protein [Pseudoalteromonas]MBB1334762.1 hypothetical protein [Pseudoalteromonas sp. SR41-6]MBB1343018.1 hypothetical protein [Pseudoalteromonas sp. SR45-6]MBB1418788.1 hypothetical protein [Pseudoalteromonas sp. SG44-1]MBB1421801.1 hypothetical protein [Pseudoalteromonas sp. SG43-7]MBB1433831.1 hypothetical protein [Pseudoalteromonas sp. SG43-6]
MTPPHWLKSVAWAALIWNLLGVIAFIMQMLMTPDMISKLPIEQQAAYSNTPIWSTIAFATAVFGGVLGCILLLLKKALARVLFALSLAGIFIQQFYNFIVINSIELLGASAVFMPIFVVVIAIILLLLSHKGKQQGWLL